MFLIGWNDFGTEHGTCTHRPFPLITTLMDTPTIPATRIAVIMPNWLGDAVMATPFLRALRGLYPHADIMAMHNRLVSPVLAGLPFVNSAQPYAVEAGGKPDIAASARLLAAHKADLAILLPNSFRSAWLAWRAGIPRRLGYAREYRRALLTDVLYPQRRTPQERAAHAARMAEIRRIRAEGNRSSQEGGAAATEPGPLPRRVLRRDFQPLPTIDYYLALAHYLERESAELKAITEHDDVRRMELGLTTAEIDEAQNSLTAQGIPADAPLALLFPGANFGASKCWMPERFAQVARDLARPGGPWRMTVLIGGSPAEKPLVDAILAALPQVASVSPVSGPSAPRVMALGNFNNSAGVSLGAVKALVARSRLMVCNDTGPRHFAVAFNIPVVTLLGPTDPRWAETFFQQERQIQIPVPCGPCQLKTCPIDHRCMQRIEPERVLEKIAEIL